MNCPIPKPENVNLVIYHAGCADGFGAAWAAWKRVGEQAEYIYMHYNDEPPDMTGKHVAIVDFSFERPVLDEMLTKAASLVVLDHHKSSKEKLGPLKRKAIVIGKTRYFLDDPKLGDNLEAYVEGSEAWMTMVEQPEFPNAVFNMDKSGAVLSWEFFHPGVPVPELLEYVQDRDLWRWELPDSQAVSAALKMRDFDFEVWSEVNDTLTSGYEDADGASGHRLKRPEFITEGNNILTYMDKASERQANRAVRATLRGPQGTELPVLVTNATMLISEIGHAIINTNISKQESRAALMWFYSNSTGKLHFSLRSHDDRPPVDGIAKEFPGGGGHRNSAGFELRVDLPLPLRIDP